MAVSRVSTSSILQGFPKSRSLLAGNEYYEPSTFVSLATTTVGSGGATSITFSSIPQNFKHLQIRMHSRASSNYSWAIAMQLNGTTNMSRYHFMGADVNSGSGRIAGSGTTTTNDRGAIVSFGAAATNSFFGASVTDILDYTNTNKAKTVRNFGGWDNNGGGLIMYISSLYDTTSAISSIVLTPGLGSFSQYSSFALYGIKG